MTAQSNLASMYYYGKGVRRDYAEAFRWYRKAAGQGDAKAQYGLGFLYDLGQGVQQDRVEALRWFRQAAEQGNARAENSVGYMYYVGKEVPQDYAEAARWYRKAGDHGDSYAQNALGRMYRTGQGVPRDYAEALRWFRQAAEQDDESAQAALAIMYYYGQGVPGNNVEAARWFGKVAVSCFLRTQVVNGRWTSVFAVFLALPILLVPQRRWGRFRWVSSALCSAACAAMLVHETLLPASFGGLLAQGLLGTRYRAFGAALWLGLLACGAVIFAVVAVDAASRSKRSEGQPPAPREAVPGKLA
ncbi:MAG TPA: tetratricopeptide repeat protein [Bryobacteraceae bacterium]|nr:tetratricopeptide repeat protein [Bryobacteraceae bacterium]